jgi:hypothetical protein
MALVAAVPEQFLQRLKPRPKSRPFVAALEALRHPNAGCLATYELVHFPIGDQAEKRGGARVDCGAEDGARGVIEGDPATSPAMLCAKVAEDQACGLAHWVVVTARQQSWLQQLASRSTSCSNPAGDEPWH